MLLSMTGYGQSIASKDGLTLTVDIQTLNARFMDINVRLPRALNQHEAVVRQKARDVLSRGKISISITYTDDSGQGPRLKLDEELLKQYNGLFDQIGAAIGLDAKPRLGDFLSFHDLISSEETDRSAEFEALLMESLDGALTKVAQMRQTEGANLALDLEQRLANIERVMEELFDKAGEFRASEFERYEARIKELTDAIPLDENRLIQEVAIMADKRDISEECIRLKSHIQLFRDAMIQEESSGKKIGFLLQEMGREINTIGSKSNKVDINHMVVSLKEEMEKIREQIQNII